VGIVVFGATGYTGRLTVQALVASGQEPTLVGRDAARLNDLAQAFPGTRTAVANADDPASLRKILEPGDVIVSTVGPFIRFGDAAVSAAVDVGAHYVDSTGEAPFIRRVFQEYGPRAEAAGVALLTALGYDYVPGNLAAALAVREGGPATRRVDVGYFLTGDLRSGMSSGTRASVAAGLMLAHHAYRDGRLVPEPAARRVRTFSDGRPRPGFSVGGSEQLALPELYPDLREVNVYLGWAGRATRAAQLLSYAQPVLTALPGVRLSMQRRAEKAMRTTGTGPDQPTRGRSGSLVIAEAFDDGGRRLARVRLGGANAYDLTARFLAWSAMGLAAGAVTAKGALGPVAAFGLDGLEKAAATAGLTRRDG
jgi:short subunit dehydrogenase-like uncharacterized protein